jgi:phospholipase C
MTAQDERIKHVVVLMMENRSFDNMLGHLTVEAAPMSTGLPQASATSTTAAPFASVLQRERS